MLSDPACEHPSLRPPGVSYTTTTDQNNSSKDPGGGGQAQPRLGLPQAGDEPAADSEVTQATNSNRSRPSGAKWTQEQQAVLQQQRPSSGRGQKRQRGDMADGANTTSPSANQGPQELQNRLAAVSERTLQYEMALKEKDNELARLKQMLAMKGEQLPGPSTQASTSVITEQELKQAYCSSVQALKDYLVISNLTSYDITGKNLPEKVTADIKALVHTISKVCLQILKPETPYVLETISKDYSSTTAADWELDKSHWINVISQLQLSNLQVLSILHARDLHLQKMQALLNERATLARQAADLTTATCSTNPVMLDDVSNVAVLMQHGYLYFARNALLLQRVVDLFKESLLREQKTVMELFLKVLYQVLSPVQAALFVVEAFPYHCDVLALSNVLALVFGRDGSNMGNMGTVPAGMSNTDTLDMMIGIGGPPAPSAPGPSGVGGNGMLSVQDAMLLHQQFGGGVSGGGGHGGADKLSLLQQQQQQGSQQDLTTGGMGAAGLGGTLGSGLGGGGGMGGGGLGGSGLGGLNSGGNPAGAQRLNPFGAMAELQSMMGGGPGGNGNGGGLDSSALRGGDAGGAGGGMSAAAVKHELQSLQAAAMARQAAGQMLGPGVGGDMASAKAAAGGGGLAVFNQQHNLSSNLSGLTQGGGLMDNGVGVGPSGVGPNPASNLSPDLMAGPGAGLGGPGPKGMSVGGGPGANLQGAGSLGVVGGLAGAGSLGGGGGLVGASSLGGGGLGASGLGGGAGLFGKAGPQGGAPTLNLSMPGAGGGGLGLGGGGGLGALGGHVDTLGSLGQQNSGSLPISTVSRYGNGPARGGVLLDAGARGPAGPGGFSR